MVKLSSWTALNKWYVNLGLELWLFKSVEVVTKQKQKKDGKLQAELSVATSFSVSYTTTQWNILLRMFEISSATY